MRSRQRFAGGGGGASSSMLRVTLWKVRIEEDVVQSSLSPSGEMFRVDAVLELRPSAPARLLRRFVVKNLALLSVFIRSIRGWRIREDSC